MPRLLCVPVVFAFILISVRALPIPHATYDEHYPMYHVHTHLDELGEYIPQSGSVALKAAADRYVEKLRSGRLSRATSIDALKGALRGKDLSTDRGAGAQ